MLTQPHLNESRDLGGWMNILADNSLHCVPIHDLKPHWMDQDGTCWCNPTEDDFSPDFWLHHSLDGREKYESSGKLQ
jgi:hypothetical protein